MVYSGAGIIIKDSPKIGEIAPEAENQDCVEKDAAFQYNLGLTSSG